ncbi:MAG: hypothetical protein R2771_00070 [Saprospiraceae bacterium]
MSVWVVPNFVIKENGIVKKVEDKEAPNVNQIYFLNDLIFLDELKRSLFQIAGGEFDLSFFTKPNDSDYGNNDNINLGLTPDDVLKCIKTIRTAFEKHEKDFIRPYEYEGVFDKDGKKLNMVFTVDSVTGFLFTKKIYRWGTISTHEGNATLQLYDYATDSWIKRIDLSKEKPVLFYAEMDSDGQKHRKTQIDWELRGKNFFLRIKPELDSIETIALYAIEKGYELQITHS